VGLLKTVAPQSRVLKKKAVAVHVAASQQESPPDEHAESGGDIRNPSPPDRNRPDQTRPDQTGSLFPPPEVAEPASGPAQPSPPPPPDFDGRNADALNGKAVVALALEFELPEQWGLDAEALGFKTDEVLREAQKFRQYFTRGKGTGTRRSVRGWSQSWSNWLDKVARDRR